MDVLIPKNNVWMTNVPFVMTKVSKSSLMWVIMFWFIRFTNSSPMKLLLFCPSVWRLVQEYYMQKYSFALFSLCLGAGTVGVEAVCMLCRLQIFLGLFAVLLRGKSSSKPSIILCLIFLFMIWQLLHHLLQCFFGGRSRQRSLSAY